MGKKILIDLGKLKARYSGLGEMSYNFGLNIINNIDLLKTDNNEVFFLVPKNYIGAFGNEVQYISLNIFRRYFPGAFPKFDVWYAAHQDSGYMPSNNSCKYILTIHDLNVSYHPNKNKAQKRLQSIQKKIDRADHLTANSNFTKKEVELKLDLKGKMMSVILCGSEDFSRIEGKKPERLVFGEQFFLHISTITPKKNTKALVELMKILPDKTLIIAGSWDNPYAREIQLQIQNERINNIICLDKVDNLEKAWLYQNCTALFFPSFLEGFGLPVIEAMYCGKPVFASTFTSLPEIGSDKAFYWPNFEPEEMKKIVVEKMSFIEANEDYKDQLKEYADQFNWTKNILQYITIFNRFLKP